MRRLRATLTIGLLWGLIWTAGAIAIGARRILFVGPVTFSGATVIGVCGLVAGVAFAVVFSRAERRRNVAGLSVGRSAVWGALGGALASPLASVFLTSIVAHDALLGAFIPMVFVGAGVMGALGAASAAATISIARRGAEIGA